MQNIKTHKLLFQKNAYSAVALQLVFAILISVFSFGHASAAGQLNSRSVQMSDSGVSGGAITTGEGDGLNVAYKFAFTATSAATVGGIVIDFCSNSALYWDTCTAPTGLLTNRGTTTLNNQANLGTGAMAVDVTGTNYNNSIVLSRTTPAAVSGASLFELGNGTTNGITNPSTLGSFYIRIYTYDTQAHARLHNPGSTTDDTWSRDFGGIAVSTANIIQITARVQENLTFCMSLAAPGSNCSGTTAPALSLGHITTGTTKFIDASAIDSGSVYSQLSTNAGAGAIVRIHSSNGTCGGLSTDGGTTCGIPPANAGAATAPGAAMAAGTAAFGLTVATATGVTPSAPYANVTSNYYGMDSTTSGSNVTTTYGSQVIASTGPVSNVNNTWTFAATASNATPAGIYSTNMAAIATGTF
jgi:hypothetical protein